MLSHPPYSPDFSPPDYFLFLKDGHEREPFGFGKRDTRSCDDAVKQYFKKGVFPRHGRVERSHYEIYSVSWRPPNNKKLFVRNFGILELQS